MSEYKAAVFPQPPGTPLYKLQTLLFVQKTGGTKRRRATNKIARRSRRTNR